MNENCRESLQSHADIHPNNSFHLARALVFYQVRKIIFWKLSLYSAAAVLAEVNGWSMQRERKAVKCIWNFLGETLYNLLVFGFGYHIYFEKLSYSSYSSSICISFHFCYVISTNEYHLLSVNRELKPDRLSNDSWNGMTPWYFVPLTLFFSMGKKNQKV